jgi:hypothetical protein
MRDAAQVRVCKVRSRTLIAADTFRAAFGIFLRFAVFYVSSCLRSRRTAKLCSQAYSVAPPQRLSSSLGLHGRGLPRLAGLTGVVK